MTSTPSAAAPAPRPRRVRPYPLDLLPRLLRAQVELSQVLWRHLSTLLAAARVSTAAGRAALERSLGGPLYIAAQAPYLASPDRLPTLFQPALAVEILRTAPGQPRFLLSVDSLLGRPLGIKDGARLAELLQPALLGSGTQIVALDAKSLATQLADPWLRAPLVLDIELRVGDHTGWARLCTSSALRVAAPPVAAPPTAGWPQSGLFRQHLASVPAQLVIEAGYGFLASQEVLSFAVGDVVLLDHFGPRPVTGGPVWLRLGHGVFPAHLDGAGVTVLGSYYLRAQAMADPQSDDTASPPAETEALNDALLRELPVQITCEIGRVTLSAREVLELRPGTVLPVGRPLAGPVDLTAGGRVLAHGELVDVEGEIGVRITEILS